MAHKTNVISPRTAESPRVDLMIGSDQPSAPLFAVENSPLCNYEPFQQRMSLRLEIASDVSGSLLELRL